MKKQNGIALLPVAIIITVIAAVSLLMSYETSMNVNETAAQSEAKKADLVAEAGMAHAKWQLAKVTDCASYANLNTTDFGIHTYSANISPDNGSPVTISANGISSTGIARTLTGSNVKVYQASYTNEFILDATGQDSFIEGESGHLDHNKGSNQHIIIKSETNKPERGLVQFDLTDIPANTKVISAELGLYLDESKGNSQEIFIHRLTDDWKQDEVTWKVKRSGFFQNWSPHGGEYVSTVSGTFIADVVGWNNVEITQLVQDWVKVPSINQGMILLSNPASGNNEKKFASSDNGDVALHPKLTITYACECGQLCVNPATSKLLFVVPNPSNLNTDDTERKDLMESWGYAVTLIDDSDSQGEFDTAVAENNVVYISETVSSVNISDKLRDATIGVVNEERAIVDDLGLSSAFLTSNLTSIEIIDTSHYITSVFANGTIAISKSSQEFSNLNGSIASGIETLAEGSFSLPTLSAIEVGGSLYDSGTAIGRRVQLPWAENGFNFSELTDDAKTIMQRSIAWASGEGEEETNNGLIAHWELDETSGLIATEAINGFDGVLENNPEWEAAGRIKGALSFDSANAQIVVPHGDLLSPTKAITMSAWIYNDSGSLSDSYRIISKETFGDNDNYFLSVQNRWLWMGIGGSFFSPSINFSANQWYHVAATFEDDADEIRMYIDGVEVLSQNTNTSLSPNSDNVYIGSNWEEFKWWEGLLDDVRLYDRALTSEEINELFNSAPAEGGGGGEIKPPEPPSESCAGNFMDEFNQREYSGSDGTLKWSTDWIEINESNGPTAGDEQVRSDLGHDYVLRIRDNDGGGEGVQRQADLSANTTATLKFLYSRDSLDNSSDYVTIEASKDGVDWNEVERISGPGTDDTYLPLETDISSFISPLTSIRFLTSSTLGGTDTVYIDNVEIEVSGCAK